MKNPKITYLQFQNELRGYDYFCKKTGNQIFRFEMYVTGYSPAQCKEKFNTIEKTKNYV